MILYLLKLTLIKEATSTAAGKAQSHSTPVLIDGNRGSSALLAWVHTDWRDQPQPEVLHPCPCLSQTSASVIKTPPHSRPPFHSPCPSRSLHGNEMYRKEGGRRSPEKRHSSCLLPVVIIERNCFQRFQQSS